MSTRRDPLAGSLYRRLVSRGAAAVLLAGFLAVALIFTLTPVERSVLDAVHLSLHDLTGLSFAVLGWIVEPLANVMLFVPLAFLLWAALPDHSAKAVWLGCTLASTLVEITQGLFLSDRTPDLLDIVTNSTGAAIGVLLYRRLRRRDGKRVPRP
jgi:VanZ family protein